MKLSLVLFTDHTKKRKKERRVMGVLEKKKTIHSEILGFTFSDT